MTRSRKCDICGESVPGANLARHKRRNHSQAKSGSSTTSLDVFGTVKELLGASDMRGNEFPEWTLEDLNALPNMRQFQPAPRRHHTSWSILPRNNVNRLPSLDALLYITDLVPCDEKRHQETVQPFMSRRTKQLGSQKPVSWIRQVFNGQSTTSEMPKPIVDSLMTRHEWEEYTMYAHQVAYQIYHPRTTCDLVRMSPQVHYTSRSTKQEVQRAPSPCVSTAHRPGDLPFSSDDRALALARSEQAGIQMIDLWVA